MSTTGEKMRVAVVGLGPAGIVAVKEFRDKGFQVTGYDGNRHIGGIWSSSSSMDDDGRSRSSSRSTGVYRELTLNTSRSLTEFSDFPWNKGDYDDDDVPHNTDEGGVFASATEYQAYLNAYAEHFQLAASFRLETRVTAIQPRGGAAACGERGYVVTTTKSNGLHEETNNQDFDAVVLCSGMQNTPKNPLGDTTLKNFTGEILHSQDVRSIADLDGKRVLVIGGAISGSDLAVHLAKRGGGAAVKKVVNSVRRVPYHVNKFAKDGQSADSVMYHRLVAWTKLLLPQSTAARTLKFLSQDLKTRILHHFPWQLTEDITKDPHLVPDENFGKTTLAYTCGYVEAARQGLLTIKPGVRSAVGNQLTFADGTSDTFDTIVCATGYRGVDLSILPADIRDAVRYKSPAGIVEAALYKRTLVPNRPDLFFIGIPNIGAFGPAAEMQARYAAAVFRGDLPRPAEGVLQEGAAAFRKHRDGGPSNRYDIASEVEELVGFELRVTPTVLQVLGNPRDLLLGPMYPCFYRMNSAVDGEEVSAKAKERWEWCCKNPMILQPNEQLKNDERG